MILTLGCDPEVFLQDKGQLLPAFEVLPKKGVSHIFWDGFQAEFATKPSFSVVDLEVEVRAGLSDMLSVVRAKRPTADFLAQDLVEINDALFDTLGMEYVQLGCDPSLNVYGLAGQIPSDPYALPYRFAGGHIHFGHPKIRAAADRSAYCANLIADLDRTVGIWSVGAAGPYERTKQRRLYYGLAGEFRIPEHGVEWRTLSNFWLAAPGIFNLTFEIAKRFFNASMLDVLKFWINDFQLTQHIINSYDVEEARKSIKLNEKTFRHVLGPLAGTALKVCYEGMESIVAKPLAIRENWGL